jgi:hypothetical protein
MNCMRLEKLKGGRVCPDGVGVFVKLDDEVGEAEALVYAGTGRFTHLFLAASGLASQSRFEQVERRFLHLDHVCRVRQIRPVLVGHLWPAESNPGVLLFEPDHYLERLTDLSAWAEELAGLTGQAWETALDTEAYGAAAKKIPMDWTPDDSCRLASLLGSLEAPRPAYVWPAGSYRGKGAYMELLALLAAKGRVTEHTLRRSQYETWIKERPYEAEARMFSIAPEDPAHWTWKDFFRETGPRIALPLEGSNDGLAKLRLAVEVFEA